MKNRGCNTNILSVSAYVKICAIAPMVFRKDVAAAGVHAGYLFCSSSSPLAAARLIR